MKLNCVRTTEYLNWRSYYCAADTIALLIRQRRGGGGGWEGEEDGGKRERRVKSLRITPSAANEDISQCTTLPYLSTYKEGAGEVMQAILLLALATSAAAVCVDEQRGCYYPGSGKSLYLLHRAI